MKEKWMSKTTFEIGSEVFHGNSRYIVIAVLDIQHVSARSAASGHTKKFNITELSSEPKDPDKPVDIIPARDLLTIPDDEWVQANNKALLLSQALQEEDEIDRVKRIEELGKKLGVSRATIYRNLRKYKDSQGNPLSLLRKKRNDSGRLPPEIEELMQQAINAYLNTLQPRVTDIYRNFELQAHQLNNSRKAKGEEPFKIPHINTLRTRLSKLTASEVASKRKGKKGRESHRPIIAKFPQPQKPLEVVQMDHTPLDLIIVDDDNRMDIGRPTVTMAIDVFSRMVTGFYISLEKPNTLLTGACLTHSILDKKQWLMDHGVEGEWPIFGLMDTLHTDNGKEFHGKSLKRACEIYKINMVKRPAGTPRYGGHIERLFKTLNDGGIHSLPGTTKSNIQDKGEYRSDKKAVMTLFEFETWLTELIVNVYHRTKHSDLGMTPLEKYRQGVMGDGKTPGSGLPTKVDDPIKLKIDFLPYEERSVQKYGIQIFGIDYFHDVLRKWIKQPDRTRKGAQKFIVRYDPRDLSSVFFYDPDMESYVVVPYRDTSHPPISLWELRELKRKAKEANPAKPADEESIFEARARMNKLTEQAQKETKHVRRMKQKEAIRAKESIPSITSQLSEEQGKNSIVIPSLVPDDDDEDFEDIQPFEDIDQ
ncbi:MAG: Mu transposase C-terminal domain-containing protein [Hydrogenovibrio sp.]|uniref:Mu transposase C-terminal domain-containing protein n=1 Tax=Hydrogenovibrio sp. TaxID=2065821 RepID=UPI0028705C29|nr:Mu transposase C-terminal domain-containing protein [Hydrogenovibrio sp.]MDR9498383.1 Mu transposase C-terminal domain-containing protein [Hydrogenovibrio sp.]